ncbi:nucleic acid-binding protein [Nadsonia fulvescens var. elongata DSM 6958]|uniref:Nucleic acid-binding protein n=1 Tax=Nadsonia fulvescens var. elongata DSM 6958 TaxID=857566 RepID=A0A1E3PD66_9ASCO|nr:nucleic acid-binding protein [Nadsonia fulvescens var. elongata DSM 6958]
MVSKPLPVAVVPTPALVDFTVGKIRSVETHPNANSLYSLSVDINRGDGIQLAVCSGLVPYYTRDQLLDRTVVLVTNLKPMKLRGLASEAMVLAAAAKPASSDHTCTANSKVVELVKPPLGAVVGSRLVFESFVSNSQVELKDQPQAAAVKAKKPSKIKMKVWQAIQSQLITKHDGSVNYIDTLDNKSAVLRRLISQDTQNQAFVTELTDDCPVS